MNHELAFPKEPKKKKTESIRSDVAESMKREFGYKCMAFLISHGSEHHGLPVDACHILPKQKNSPWRDIKENMILLDRKCHDRFDGRDKAHGYASHKCFQLWVVKSAYTRKEEPLLYLEHAYKYLNGDIGVVEYEEILKQIYYQRIGE